MSESRTAPARPSFGGWRLPYTRDSAHSMHVYCTQVLRRSNSAIRRATAALQRLPNVARTRSSTPGSRRSGLTTKYL